MDLPAILLSSLWAGLFATGLGIILTAPLRYAAPAFLCGFCGRFVRDVFVGWGMSFNWATAVAAAAVVLIALAVIRRHAVSPVVLISGVLPLGAAVAMFNAIVDVMKVSSYKGAALADASVSLSANAGKVFTTSLAIALGLGVGIAIARLVKREPQEEDR